MAIQTVFKRCEMKYMITTAQREFIVAEMEPYMTPDLYGKTTVRNIYYDTDTYLLVRRSIEKPVYKEKLRIRSYEQANPDSIVFVELKKKYKGEGFKRRVPLPLETAARYMRTGEKPHPSCQVLDGFLCMRQKRCNGYQESKVAAITHKFLMKLTIFLIIIIPYIQQYFFPIKEKLFMLKMVPTFE